MAIATAAAIVGGLSLASGVAKSIDGNKRSKRAQRELDAYERTELDNAFKNVAISTLGSDLLREEGALTSAGLIDATRQAGTRGIIGGIPRISSINNKINQDAALLLDNQQQKREYAIAEDETRIRAMLENRDIANIAGLSSQVEAGRQDMWSGISDGLAAAGSIGRQFKDSNGVADTNDNLVSGKRPQLRTANTLESRGLIPTDTLGSEFSSSLLYNQDSLNYGSKIPKYGGKYLTR